MFESVESLIRLDMSEYMEKHSVSKIIGSPPGYVGYDEAGQLTEKIRRRPYSVILFDELEKAHPDVLNILLQILDDGRITDAQGRVVNFENTIIIMTSNAGSNQKGGSVGFGRSLTEQSKEKAMKALGEFLRPEFINRVDEIVCFNQLSEDNFRGIADIMLAELQQCAGGPRHCIHVGRERQGLSRQKVLLRGLRRAQPPPRHPDRPRRPHRRAYHQKLCRPLPLYQSDLRGRNDQAGNHIIKNAPDGAAGRIFSAGQAVRICPEAPVQTDEKPPAWLPAAFLERKREKRGEMDECLFKRLLLALHEDFREAASLCSKDTGFWPVCGEQFVNEV